jgi:hypothetical protein
MNSTSYFYNHSSQWRYETVTAQELLSPMADKSRYSGHLLDFNVRAERMGWLPSAPQLGTNPLRIAEEAKKAGMSPVDSTVEAVARALSGRRDMRIITNSLRVAQILYKNTDLEVMVPGGTLRAHNGGIVGPGAVNYIAEFRADYLITSVGAIESDGTLLEFDVNEATVAKTMMSHARYTLLVADHTKFFASAAVSVGNASKVKAFFTDGQPPAAFSQLLEESKVELVIAEQEESKNS